MHRRTWITSITWSSLALITGGTFLLPGTLSIAEIPAASGPATIDIHGVVRDFSSSHPDFDVEPAEGFGHYAGMVKFGLGGDYCPVPADLIDIMRGGTTEDVDLVGAWTFDEMSGTVAKDGSADANHGTLTNGPTWVPGRVGGGALHFDGVNDFVNVPSDPALMITGDVTIAGWFKLDEDFDASSAKSRIIMEKYQDDEHNTAILLVGDDYGRAEVPKGTLLFKVEHGPTTMYFRYKWTNRDSWNAGEWYHFACTLRSSDSATNQIIVNGVDDTATADLGTFPLLDWDYATDFRIGGRDTDYYQLEDPAYFKGCIDDVKIFSRVLTEEEIRSTSPGAYLVTDEWRDVSGDAIAPHMAREGSAVRLVSAPTLDGNTVDSYDPDAGPYGGANVGSPPEFAVGATMPTLTEPTGLPPYVPSDIEYSDGSHTLNTDLHCRSFTMKKAAKVTVEGNLTIFCEENYLQANSSKLFLAPGATLTVYVKTGFVIKQSAQFNAETGGPETPDPRRAMVYNLGSGLVGLESSSKTYATIVSPDGALSMVQSCHFYGTFEGESLAMTQSTQFHLARDTSAGAICGTAVADTFGTAGPSSSVAVTSATTFNEWFNDVMGTNFSIGHTITLTDIGGGLYQCNEPEFHPIDGRLFGNEGLDHNWFFTYAFKASFVYDECSGQFVSFKGDDDMWLFVDGQLLMDLGGVRGGQQQYGFMDRLDLVDGEQYDLYFFYAQRQDTSSGFSLTTNIELISDDDPMVTYGGFD